MTRNRIVVGAAWLLLTACGSENSSSGNATGIDALAWVAAPSTLYYGQSNVPLSVAVFNMGTSSAGAVQVDGSVDAPLTLASATGVDWTCTLSASSYTCQHPGPINASGGLPVISLAVSTPASSLESLASVCATVSTKGDGNASNNTSCRDIELLLRTAEYDVQVSKGLLLNTSLNAGSPATYQLVVTNHGPDAVGDVITLTDTLPANMIINGVGAPLAGTWTCSTAAQTITCTRVAGMALYQTDTILVYVTLANDARGEIENCATVSAPQDVVTNNNTACHTGVVPEPAPFDVSLLKTVWIPYNPPTNTSVSYQLLLKNLGPNPTNGLVKIVDVLPTGLTLTGYAGTLLWSCSTSGSTVTCLLPTSIPVGDQEQLTLIASVAPGTPQPFLNCANVVATGDTNAQNNRSCTESTPQIDLVLEKELIGDVTFGGTATYQVSISNVGNTEIPWPAQFSDPLPDGVSRLSTNVISGSWTCNNAYVWSIVCAYSGPLPVPLGPLGTIQYTVNVPAVEDLEVSGFLINCATAKPEGPDMTPEDNTDCVATRIPKLYDVATAVEVIAQPTTGGTTTFGVSVINRGKKSVSQPVTVGFTLPAGVEFLGTLSVGWACASDDAESSSVVTCTATGPAQPGALPALEVDVWVTDDVTPGTNLEMCFDTTPNDDDDNTNNQACINQVVGSDPDCNNHRVAPTLIYYEAVYNAAVALLDISQEPFTHDASGTALPQGEQIIANDGFVNYQSATVTSVGASAQMSNGSPVDGVTFDSVLWDNTTGQPTVRSFVGDDALRGHDALRIDFVAGAQAVALRTTGITRPTWLSVFDTTGALAEVFLVTPSSQLVGLHNVCGTAIGGVQLEPAVDRSTSAGTEPWGLQSVEWAN